MTHEHIGRELAKLNRNIDYLKRQDYNQGDNFHLDTRIDALSKAVESLTVIVEHLVSKETH